MKRTSLSHCAHPHSTNIKTAKKKYFTRLSFLCLLLAAHSEILQNFCSFAQISERHVAVVGFGRQAARVRRLRNLHSAVELFEPERRQV